MKVIELPLEQLVDATWNPNQMSSAMLNRLQVSIRRYGLVENLVVREITGGLKEVLSGNKKLEVLRGLGHDLVPCVVVNLDDAQARLLAQALNAIQGEDDLGLRAEVMRKILETTSQEDILAVLPETADSLGSLAALGQEDIASHLQAWQRAQSARLKHLTVQLTSDQMEVVESALESLLPEANESLAQGRIGDRAVNPNIRGQAMFLLCEKFLKYEAEP